MTYAGKERRKYPRVNINAVIQYRVLGVVENLNLGHTKNISIGGFLLATERQMPLGTSLLLEISLPERTEPVKLMGRVVGSDLNINGVTFDTRLEFLAIDEEHKKTIRQIIENHSLKPNKPDSHG